MSASDLQLQIAHASSGGKPIMAMPEKSTAHSHFHPIPT